MVGSEEVLLCGPKKSLGLVGSLRTRTATGGGTSGCRGGTSSVPPSWNKRKNHNVTHPHSGKKHRITSCFNPLIRHWIRSLAGVGSIRLHVQETGGSAHQLFLRARAHHPETAKVWVWSKIHHLLRVHVLTQSSPKRVPIARCSGRFPGPTCGNRRSPAGSPGQTGDLWFVFGEKVGCGAGKPFAGISDNPFY